MRVIPFLISAIITFALVFVLNKKWGPIPPLGKFLSPQHGFWQNAEAADEDFGAGLKFPNLKGKVNVYFDERLVPHVFADNNEDLYFVQGYLHARFRLFQMDLQTMYAAGRLTEILGNNPDIIKVDRETRRSGMVYAAQNALKEFESDPLSKLICDAYTAGVNAYVESLTESQLPIEYKLLDFKPEKWSNLKIALFLKQMSRTLAGEVDDLELTNEKAFIPFSEFKILYPQVPDSLIPIVPAGTKFDAPGIIPVKPATADSLYFGEKDTTRVAEVIRQDPDNGSNNWAVAGIKTKSGAPILCNDPHLDLTFPSIWYEMQLNSPDVNVYGATFPGSPNVVIGFNDHIAWGVTNSQRDVKDFYEIKFKDDSKKQYWFNGKWVNTQIHIDTLKVRDADDIYDTVAYTIFGPVMFDKSFADSLAPGKAIACRWAAHDPSNEGRTFYKLNRATNYDDYLDAIKTFACPGQNFVFAAKSGDIALWQQGKFPARWDWQGMMIMPGEDSSYLWQGFIPQVENPHAVNPQQGFLVSANQRPADSSYPYFIPGAYINARAISINEHLKNMSQITVDDMKRLQNDYFNATAEDARPLLLKYIRENDLNTDAKRYLDIIKNWDLRASPDSKGQTVYKLWWDSLAVQVWGDELDKVQPVVVVPNQQTLLEALLKDSAFKYVDNVNTPQKETLNDDVTIAFQKASVELAKEEKDGKLEWTKHKSPRIYHLLRQSLMPFSEPIAVGGNGDIINATTTSHGPSWRMIVQLTENTEAYGVYPGGQSGNPGSKFYDDFVDSWTKGHYYSLWMMKKTEMSDKRVKWTMNFGK
ncbi:MAG: penicillin acylase family protein [Chitinophagales bacterium]